MMQPQTCSHFNQSARGCQMWQANASNRYSDLDPRWLTKRRSPCECLHGRGHWPTPCCTSPASITSGDDGQWCFFVCSNRGLSDSQKTTTPSAPILFNFLSLDFLCICVCFSISSSFQSNYLWSSGSSSGRNGVSFLRLGRSSAASGPNAQGSDRFADWCSRFLGSKSRLFVWTGERITS